jgi:ADP-ribose pyrophosphatase YjhB (NUDIX family)
MNFCSQCGDSVELKIPEGDNRLRHICNSCGSVHYSNPKIVAGCIPEWEDKILLCKRAIEPRHGLWTLPAGFMENNESTGQAAMRETLEEAQARVDSLSLYALFDIPRISQVYIIYRARLLDLDFQPGIESLEVELFTEQQIPWDQLAFAVMHETLQRYFADRKRGQFQTHVDDIVPH